MATQTKVPAKEEPQSKETLEEQSFPWSLVLSYRLLNALLVWTYFNPDEFWQSLEIAHGMPWEWRAGLRSYIPVLPYAGLYKLLELLALDTPTFLMFMPKLLHGFVQCLTDFYMFELARQFFGPNTARWSLVASLGNWFVFYCGVRPFSNNLEACLTLAVLCYWPWPARYLYSPPVSSSLPNNYYPNSKTNPASQHQTQQPNNGSTVFPLCLAAVAFLVRPTSAIQWLLLGLFHLKTTETPLKFLFQVLFIAALSLVFALAIDSLFYGRLVLVSWNFAKFNFLEGGASWFGTHAFHWYFTSAWPTMLLTMLPHTIQQLRQQPTHPLAFLLIQTTAIYSLLPHKEFRFLYPVLGLALIFFGKSMASRRPPDLLTWLLFLTQIPVAIYFSLFHQRAPVEALEWLSDRQVLSVDALLPCHSTPHFAALHRNVPFRYLDCSPPGHAPAELPLLEPYIDQADQFKANPMQFLEDYYETRQLPSHVLVFDSMRPNIEEFLDSGFEFAERFLHNPITQEYLEIWISTEFIDGVFAQLKQEELEGEGEGEGEQVQRTEL